MRLLLASLALAFLSSCGQTTTLESRNAPLGGARFATADETGPGPGSTGGNPAIIEGTDKARSAGLSYLALCIDLDDAVEFETADDVEVDADPLDEIPIIDLKRSRISLRVKGVKPGIYTEIEVPLARGCGGSTSLAIQNKAGAFTSRESLTLEFEGLFVVPRGVRSSDGVTVNLDISAFVSSLAAVSSDQRAPGADEKPIEAAINSVTGSIL